MAAMPSKAAVGVAQPGGALPTEPTRQRILDAARIDFAEHGLQQASVRRITELAGANIALISYHFGSKQQLFDAVLEDCVAQLNRPRLDRLDALEAEAGGAPVPVAALLAVYVAPYLESALGQSRDAAIDARFGVALEQALPQARRQNLFLRFASLNGAMIGLFSGTGSLEQISGGLCATRPARAFWAHFVSVWTDMLQAPSRPFDAKAEA